MYRSAALEEGSVVCGLDGPLPTMLGRVTPTVVAGRLKPWSVAVNGRLLTVHVEVDGRDVVAADAEAEEAMPSSSHVRPSRCVNLCLRCVIGTPAVPGRDAVAAVDTARGPPFTVDSVVVACSRIYRPQSNPSRNVR